MKNIEIIRNEFKNYLINKGHSQIDAKTIYSDADYPRKHYIGIDYWTIFKTNETLEEGCKLLEQNFGRKNSKPNRIIPYKRALKLFKEFVDTTYGDVENLINSNEPNYYFVSQGTSYKEEKEKSIIKAPIDNLHHHSRLKDLKPDDIIINYYKGKIVATSQVISRPIETEINGIKWWVVQLKYKELAEPISSEKYISILKNYNITSYKYGPFDKNLGINQGYLFGFSKYLHDLIINNKIGVNMATITTEDLTPTLNLILYGPPGTGKTYNTVIKAIEIIKPDIIKYASDNNITNYKEIKEEFDKLKEAHQIEFVTFHQSYSYEDFVEGIKPLTDDKGQIKYSVQPGIFKNLCNEAQKIISSHSGKRVDFSKTRIFKMSLGNTMENDDYIYEYCITNNVVALGWGDNKNFSDCNSKSEISALDNSWGAKAIEIFKLWMRKGDIILISNGNKNIRAIARITGDYEFNTETPIRYSQFRNVEWLYHGDDIPVSKIYDKILSQQAIYAFYNSSKEGTEFYNGNINTEYLNNIITGEINDEPEKPYILIIDEINRGNVSKIFGELITLIEKDKRLGNEHELKVTLPYSQRTFGVPKNVHIIGTMNTADRSIALLDTALRRRFDFEEIIPDPELLKNRNINGINLTKLLEKINCRITENFDRDHQIGHAYFMSIADEKDLQRVFKNKIYPLLNEYFYNDLDSVAKVLNCNIEDLKNINNNWLKILINAQNDK